MTSETKPLTEEQAAKAKAAEAQGAALKAKDTHTVQERIKALQEEQSALLAAQAGNPSKGRIVFVRHYGQQFDGEHESPAIITKVLKEGKINVHFFPSCHPMQWADKIPYSETADLQNAKFSWRWPPRG